MSEKKSEILVGTLSEEKSIIGSLPDEESFVGGIIDNVIYRGKSVYEVWLDAGHEGTEEDFFKYIASLIKEQI